MRCSDVIFAVLPTLAVGLSPLSKRDYWGPAFSSGPTSNGVTVRYAAMTLTPGRAPPNPRGDLFIWPGVGGDVDLLQVVFLTAENCNAPQGSWCAQPYVAGPRYINGPVAVVGPNDRIRIKYELQADGVHWIQSATNLATGKVITQLQSDSGDHQKGVGTAIECNQNCQPTVSDHTYVD